MPIIGRDYPADIIVPAPQVSARHAEIVHVAGGRYQLTDLGSANGTYVNGARVQSILVRLTDQVHLGSHPLSLVAYAHLIPAGQAAPASVPQWAGAPAASHAWEACSRVEGPPWERRPTIGLAKALIDTVKGVLGSPSAFFRTMGATGGLGPPLLFAIGMGWLAALATAFYQLVAAVLRSRGMVAIGAAEVIALATAVVVISILMPIAMSIGLFLGAGIDHLALLMLGGARRGFEATARVHGYVDGGTSVLLLVPVVGMIVGGLVHPVLRIIGLSEAHGIGRGRAAVAVLTPWLACLLALGGLLVLVSGGSTVNPFIYTLF